MANENNSPLVSFMMPVYNGEEYIKETLDSLQAQTLSDFEVIIINDGSTDSTVDIIESYHDERFKIIHNETNLGITGSLNKGFKVARGKYIARIDCDDLCYPKRLEVQVEHMEKHPELVLCGAFRDDILDGKIKKNTQIPVYSYEVIKMGLLFGNFFFTHSTLMFRRELFQNLGLEYPEYKCVEDYALEMNILMNAKADLVPEKLVAYRIYAESFSNKNMDIGIKNAKIIKENYLAQMDVSAETKAILQKALEQIYTLELIDQIAGTFPEIAKWSGADKMPKQVEALTKYLYRSFYFKLERYNYKTLMQYMKHPYGGITGLLCKEGLLLLGGCILCHKRNK